MYENLSQKIKLYTKAFTIVLMALILLGGVGTAFMLIRLGNQLYTLIGIGVIFFAAILDIVIYLYSLFAYGFGELLAQQATQINLSRQILNAQRDSAAPAAEKPAAAVPPTAPAAPSMSPRQPVAPPRPSYPAYPTDARRPYGYPQPEPTWQQPQEQPWQPKQPPYGTYPGSYRTQNPYGTSSGFNEDYHYEPKR